MAVHNRMPMTGSLVPAKKVAVSVAALTLAVGLVFQRCTTMQDERRYPMPGVMGEVKGQRMHLDCRGQGSSTLVLRADLGDSVSTWSLFQPNVAKFTWVCSYDSPGLG